MKRKTFLIGIDARKVSHLKSVKSSEFSKIIVAFLKGIQFFTKIQENPIMKI